MPHSSENHTDDKDVEVLNVRRKVHEDRRWVAGAADKIGVVLASPWFFAVFLFFHVAWVVLNLPIWPYEPFDPYPFTFLATIASAEAPFIALLILMHQQRETQTAEVREEIDLQVSLHIERELTVVLRMICELQEKLGVQTNESEESLQKLRRELDPERLMSQVRKHLNSEEGESEATAV